jgi:hypothetical protein
MSRTQHWAGIGLLLVGVGALLGWLAAHAEVLYADGLRYIHQARTIDRGAWGDGLLRAVDHPVYPLEVVAAHRLMRGRDDDPESWQAAAQAAAVLAGVLLVVPLSLLTCELFGDGAAWPGCLLVYAVPLTGHVFADALSESTFLLFWAAGLWTALRFLRAGSAAWLIPTMGLAVLAYLTRPEGLLLPAALLATLLLLPWVPPLRLGRRRWWAAVGMLAIGPACLVGPYVAVKGGIGTKPSIARLLGTAPKAPPAAVERLRPLDPDQTAVETAAQAVKAVAAAVREAVTLPLLPLALVGLVFRRRAGPRAWLFLAIAGGAAILALLRLHATAGYCSPRHALVLALVLIPAAAAGLAQAIDAAGGLVAGRIPAWLRPRVVPLAWVAALGALACAWAPRTLAPLNEGFGGYRTAGRWLQERVEAGARVVDVSGWALYYGRLDGYTFANLVAAPADPAARWVVAREAHLRGPWPYCAELREMVGPAEPVAVFLGANPRHPTKVMVFDRWAPLGASAMAPSGRRQ